MISTLHPGELLERVDHALDEARSILERFQPDRIESMKKAGGDPLTAADLEVDRVLNSILQKPGEGWLSEETVDDRGRLESNLVWIVDPLDGTREFIDGLPEFCTSIAAVIDGRPVAGGIVNPAADLKIIGAVGQGVTCNGERVAVEPNGGKRVLASRSECNREEWVVVEESGWQVIPMGSVAYKIARVAAGLDPATWTPVPKHEWDVAGGAALLAAAGGVLRDVDLEPILFNQPNPLLSGAIAVGPAHDYLLADVKDMVAKQRKE